MEYGVKGWKKMKKKLIADLSWFYVRRNLKIQDGRQNPMSLSRAWTALWICFMFGFKERPHPVHVLISFWCDSDNNNFFLFQNFCGYFIFVNLATVFNQIC